MRGSGGLALLVVVGACSSDVSRTLGPTDFDFAGEWLFSEALGNATLDLFCNASGLMMLIQDGPRFSAEGTQSGECTGPGGTESFSDLTVTMTDGIIDGTRVSFRVDECPYVGTAHGVAPDSVAGTVACSLLVEGRRVSLEGEWRFVPPPDNTPPTVSGSTYGGGANGILEAGDDTLYVRIRAEDDKALRVMGYELTDPSRGALVRRDSVPVSGTSSEDTLAFPLPLDLILPVPEGTPFQAGLFARDTAGNLAFGSLDPVVVTYPSPPTVMGSLAGAVNDSAGALRDTLEISVTVSSPRPLVYFGYRITSLESQGDSIATDDVTGSHTFRLPVPFAWKGQLLTLEVFARDRLGLEDRQPLESVRVVVFPSRPTQILQLDQGVSDLTHDPFRGRVYLATATAGGPEVRVLQLEPAEFLAGIPLPWMSEGLDLSPGGDSLIVTLYNTRLGIIDLTTLAIDSTAPIAFTPSNGRYPFRVRVAANNKAMVSIASAYWGDGSPGQLVEFDLATQVQTLRTDVGTGGDVGLMPLLARSSDRQRLLVFPSQAATIEGQIYESVIDQFGPSVALTGPTAGGAGISGDRAGSLWLVGNHLLGSDLSSLRTLGSAEPEAIPSVLADDGMLAYVAVPEGVARYQTSDGEELERILLPDPPYLLLVTPDGKVLIGIGSPGLMLVDLR